jgi:hypothetical protein
MSVPGKIFLDFLYHIFQSVGTFPGGDLYASHKKISLGASSWARTRARVAAIMPAKEELDGDAADEGSVQHGDSDRCRGSGAEEAEEVAELPKQFAQTKIMKPQSWTTSLSMTASLPTLVLGDADDGKSPGAAAAAAVPAQQLQAEDLIHRRNALDAHESRMLKAFGKAYIKRTKSDSEVASENAIARIMALRASITEQNERSNKTLNSCQSLMDACGDAIAAWFKGLSGAALKRAIKEVRVDEMACVYFEHPRPNAWSVTLDMLSTRSWWLTMSLSVQAFDKFDEDGSGLMGRDEFAKAMHTLGLRLTAAEYDILFDEYDEDKSGEIDLVSARSAHSPEWGQEFRAAVHVDSQECLFVVFLEISSRLCVRTLGNRFLSH